MLTHKTAQNELRNAIQLFDLLFQAVAAGGENWVSWLINVLYPKNRAASHLQPEYNSNKAYSTQNQISRQRV